MNKTLKINNIISKVESVIETIDKHPNIKINYGGCGVFAFYMHQALNKLGVKNKIVAVDKRDKIVSKKKDIKKNNLHAELACYHISIKIADYIIDGEEIKSTKEWKDEYSHCYQGKINLNELEVMLIHGSWNDSYDTDYNSKVQRIIESKLEVKIPKTVDYGEECYT